MPGKASNPLMWGQDVPYFANSPKTQEYEQTQKSKRTLRMKMQKSGVPAETFLHKKAVEHGKTFCNWRLANQIHGTGQTKKLRLF